MRSIDASNGGRDSHLMPESEARYIRVTMPRSRSRRRHRRAVRARPGVRRVAERVHQVARQAGAAGAAIRAAYLDEQTYWTIVGVDGDTEEGMLSEDGALEVAQGQLFASSRSSRRAASWLTWADVHDRPFARGRLSADPERRVEASHDRARRPLRMRAAQRRQRHAFTRSIACATRRRRGSKSRCALAVRPFQVNPPASFSTPRVA